MLLILVLLILSPVAFSYAGYPLLMRVLARTRPKPWRQDDSHTPTISVILAVHNEEDMIHGCLRSIVEQNYPPGKIEILVGSDGSTDRTNQILVEAAQQDPNILPLLFSERRGKMPVLNDIVSQAKNEILIFADADIQFGKDAFRAHARHYVDPSVGCVSGYLSYQGKNDAPVLANENGYMSVENILRQNEAIVWATIGLFGGNYSLRRSDWKDIPYGAVHDDLFATLQIISAGKRTVFDNEAISVEPFVRTMRDEFKRKTRNAGRGFRTLALFPELLSPKAGVIAFMVWSHRMLRWGSPVFLLSAFLLWLGSVITGSSVALLDYAVIAFLSCISLGFFLNRIGVALPGINQLYWFSAMNLAFAIGGARFLLGKEPVLWTQTSRADIQLSEKEAVGL